MSTLNDNLTRLSNAKDNIADAITAKGGTVGRLDGFEDFASDIASITNQYTSSDEGKVVSSGQLVAQTAYGNRTTNGTVDTTTNNSIVVNVPTYSSADNGKVIKNGVLSSQTSYGTRTTNGTVNTTYNNSIIVNVPTAIEDTLIDAGNNTTVTYGKIIISNGYMYIISWGEATRDGYENAYKVKPSTIILSDYMSSVTNIQGIKFLANSSSGNEVSDNFSSPDAMYFSIDVQNNTVSLVRYGGIWDKMLFSVVCSIS
jgi:hypothetical protein